jgi:hypothetical protein
MDLIQDAATRLKLDPDTVAAAFGSLLMGMRMGVDARTWDQLKKSVPDVTTLLARAPKSGGRTAEMIALTAPGAFRTSLQGSGLTPAQVDGLAETLRTAVRSHLPADMADKVVAALDRAIA